MTGPTRCAMLRASKTEGGGQPPRHGHAIQRASAASWPSNYGRKCGDGWRWQEGRLPLLPLPAPWGAEDILYNGADPRKAKVGGAGDGGGGPS